MKTNKKSNLIKDLRDKANKRNKIDCESIIEELKNASKEGEYSKTIKMKVNQAFYLKTLGVNVSTSSNAGLYEISWKDKNIVS